MSDNIIHFTPFHKQYEAEAALRDMLRDYMDRFGEEELRNFLLGQLDQYGPSTDETA